MVRERLPVIIVATGRPGLGCSVVSSLIALAAMSDGSRVLWLEANAADGGPDTLAARVAQAGEHDLLVVDAGSRLDGLFASCSLGGRRTLLLVTGESRPDLAAAYAVAKSAHSHPDAPAIAIASNRLDDSSGQWAAEILVEACGRFLGRAPIIAGVIPDDATLSAALSAGMTIADAAEGSPTLDAARQILSVLRTKRSVLGKNVPVRQDMPGSAALPATGR
jgi:MinD-like ATPase involved in chromosome partitioning or flagellar assembly